MATLLAATTSCGAGGTGTGEEAPGAGGKGGITWEPCEEEPAVECGRLAVPIDWSKPDGPKVDLALARRKATDPSARIGSLLINPGGPGNSGVNGMFRPAGFSAEVQRHFDIVGYDPRGVARSGSVTCSASVYNEMPSPIMTSQDDYDKWISFNKRLHADCRKRTGPLYDHLDSLNVARDMDAIRAALGDDKLTSYGVSYGTLAQQMYAELFPDRIRAMVLDGSMDHSLDAKAFQVSEAAAVQDGFDEFVAWCERDTGCVLHGRDVRALWQGLLEKASRGELYWPGVTGRPVSAHNLRWLGVILNEAPDWRLEAQVLNALDGGPVPDNMPGPPGNGPVSGEHRRTPHRDPLLGLRPVAAGLRRVRRRDERRRRGGPGHAVQPDADGRHADLPGPPGHQPAAPAGVQGQRSAPGQHLHARPLHAVRVVGQRGRAVGLQGHAVHLRGLGPRHLRQDPVHHDRDGQLPDLPDRARAGHSLPG
ncbi:hypothetical protein GCM10020220_029960 [Nonomuraea rubra]